MTNKELNGLGGWLTLVGIGVVFAPIRMIVSSFRLFKPVFEEGTWGLLTTVGSEAYNPLWAPLIIGEMLCNSIMLAAMIYMAYLFFSKHHLFPKLFIGITVASLIIVPLDAWITTKVLPDQPMFDPATTKEFMRSLFTSIVWVPYMLISKRVRATFVVKIPNKIMQPISEGLI